MLESGIVSRSISGNVVEVALKKGTACEQCRACQPTGEGLVAIAAVDAIGAKIGDLVELEIATGEVIRDSAIVYLLPVLALAIGYLFGAWLARLLGVTAEEFAGIIAGLGSLSASFMLIKWYDSTFPTIRAKIIRKV
jgi:sigma-E factor negative regulatory protein RseC